MQPHIIAETVRQLREVEQRMLDNVVAIRTLIARTQEHCSQNTVRVMHNPVLREHRYDKAIVEILSSAGHRLTFAPLHEALGSMGHRCHEATVKRHLKHLMRIGRIDNSQTADPPGYGLVG